MPENPPVIELKNVSKWFRDARSGQRLTVLDNLDLTIADAEAGEFVVLLGPSGCGKSTVMNLIGGIIIPDQGEVHVHGKLVHGDTAGAVSVPQAYTCFPWLTVQGNVEFGLGILGQPKEERRRIALEYLDKVKLTDRRDAYPQQLSGGMQQRVAIARTLAMKPLIVLMDEPFGALDAQTRADMQQMLLRLWEEEKNTVLFITHDISEALLLADRIVVFSPRPARIVHDMVVPFDRPRHASLLFEPAFANLSRALMELLKHPPTGDTPPGDTPPGDAATGE
jgi:NitT/TauT family transport system ATP-binding protein